MDETKSKGRYNMKNRTYDILIKSEKGGWLRRYKVTVPASVTLTEVKQEINNAVNFIDLMRKHQWKPEGMDEKLKRKLSRLYYTGGHVAIIIVRYLEKKCGWKAEVANLADIVFEYKD